MTLAGSSRTVVHRAAMPLLRGCRHSTSGMEPRAFHSPWDAHQGTRKPRQSWGLDPANEAQCHAGGSRGTAATWGGSWQCPIACIEHRLPTTHPTWLPLQSLKSLSKHTVLHSNLDLMFGIFFMSHCNVWRKLRNKSYSQNYRAIVTYCTNCSSCWNNS